jgi:hypothetical protein
MATDFLEFFSTSGSDGKGVGERHMDARGGALTKETGTTTAMHGWLMITVAHVYCMII